MPYRKHLRLKEFDYTSSNWYFVTICTRNREKLFVPAVDSRYEVNKSSVAAGLVPANLKQATIKVAATSLVENILTKELPNKYNVEIDFYVFMEDHIHFVTILSGDHKGRSYTLGQIIGAFKSLATRACWSLGIEGKMFQPNFYEHVIRNEKSLDQIHQYILINPMIEYEHIPWKLIDP